MDQREARINFINVRLRQALVQRRLRQN